MIGKIDKDHPLFESLLQFIDLLLKELPYHQIINQAVENIISEQSHNITKDHIIIMFPDYEIDIANSVIDFINIKTQEYFETQEIQGVKAILNSLIMFQLRLYTDVPNSFRKLFSATSTKEVSGHFRRLYSLVDCLWYCAEDRATDFNYYSKRFLLGNIYTEILFYSLNDQSDHFNDTERYLIRCFDKIGKIEKIKQKLPNINQVEEKIFDFLGQLRYK